VLACSTTIARKIIADLSTLTKRAVEISRGDIL
jgi:hypothetical protein